MKRWSIPLLAMMIAAALALPAVAKPISKNIRLTHTAKVGAAQITAGEYTLLVEGEKVTVRKGKTIIAEAQARWEDRESKYANNSYLINRHGQLEEVRFAGDSRVLILLTP